MFNRTPTHGNPDNPRYWGQRFWQRGYFSTTSGIITDDIIMRYLDRHTHKNRFSPSP